MTVQELLKGAQHVYDDSGKPTGVFLNVAEWEQLVSMLSDLEQNHQITTLVSKIIDRDRSLLEDLAAA